MKYYFVKFWWLALVVLLPVVGVVLMWPVMTAEGVFARRWVAWKDGLTVLHYEGFGGGTLLKNGWRDFWNLPTGWALLRGSVL